MKILVTGSSGLIGSALVQHLTHQGHQVVRMVRRTPAPGEDTVEWDPAAGKLETRVLEQSDAVVHLAGENIGASRWTDERKKRILDSRVRSTQLLSETLGHVTVPPRVLVCASAVGFYGSRGEEILTEDSPPGSGFLPDICRQWEAATEPARWKGVRVVNLRIGMVLSGNGGALSSMLPAFKAGIGGKLGDGRQFVSWIAIDDLVQAISHAIATESLSGAVNAVSPNPVPNTEMTKALGRVLRRPTFMSMPALAVRLMFGEMADALLLASLRVQPKRLLDSCFTFRFPKFEAALRHALDSR